MVLKFNFDSQRIGQGGLVGLNKTIRLLYLNITFLYNMLVNCWWLYLKPLWMVLSYSQPDPFCKGIITSCVKRHWLCETTLTYMDEVYPSVDMAKNGLANPFRWCNCYLDLDLPMRCLKRLAMICLQTKSISSYVLYYLINGQYGVIQISLQMICT